MFWMFQHDDADALLSEFNGSSAQNRRRVTSPAVLDDVVSILQHLCEKLGSNESEAERKQTMPLVLEGITAVLVNSPTKLNENQAFLDIVW